MNKERFELTFDLICKSTENLLSPPVYRIYVDKDLLTERSFIWNPSETYIEELVTVFLEAGPHSMRVEHVGNDSADFVVENFKINGKSSQTNFNIN